MKSGVRLIPDDPCLNRLEGLDVDILDGDLTDGEFAKRVVSGTDAVIHTANLVGPHGSNSTRKSTWRCRGRAGGSRTGWNGTST